MGPGWAILSYGRQSLGEGLSFGKVWDAMFMLSGAISWVGKHAQLNIKALSLCEGWQLISQAITEWHVKARGPGHPYQCPPVLLPFRFHNQDGSPPQERPLCTDEHVEELRHTHWMSHHDQGWAPQYGQDCGQMWWDPWVVLSLSPSPDCRFKSDGSSVSTSSSMSLCSGRSGGCRHAHHGQCHRDPGGHMKINLPFFKDEDKKDTIISQSWWWDLMVYCHTGCWDCTLLPYIICSLQSYPGELVRSLGTDVTLDDILVILDEYYNNVKALDTLNHELFQL